MKNYKFIKPNRFCNRVFIHCSATDNPSLDNVEAIIKMHKSRGWSTIGYHYYIKKDGTIQDGRNLERTPISVKGNNQGTIAICCGGLEKSKFTQEQFNSLKDLCNQINIAYNGQITYHGHTEFSPKSCPVYDYKGILNLNGNGQMVLDSKIGDRIVELTSPYGRDVKWLQEQLNCKPIDGLFGKITESAVKEFQEEHGETIDGIVGYLTWDKLFEVFGDPNIENINKTYESTPFNK